MTTAVSYARPGSIPELLKILDESGPGARIIAGGTDLMVRMRRGDVPKMLVNISRIDPLRQVEFTEDALEVGATATIAQLCRNVEVLRRMPLLWHSCDKFASPLVRSRATVGGNLCNASPAADVALALLGLDAVVNIVSRGGARALTVDEFLLGPGKTALKQGEFVTGVRIPLRKEARLQRFEKSGHRPALEISVTAVALSLMLQGDRVVDPRVAFGAVAPVPMRGKRTERALAGKPLTVETIDAAAHEAAAEIRPIDDVRATAVYRRRLTAAFVRRALGSMVPGSAVRTAAAGSV